MRITSLALAALALAGSITSVRAQASLDDLVLGFEASSGTGSADDIEIDLGAVSSFTGLGAGTYTVGNLGTELTSTFGAWNSDASLTFGVVGTNGPTTANGVYKDTIWATSNGSTAYVSSASATQSTPTGRIQGLYGLTGAVGSFGSLSASDTTLGAINAQTNQIGTSLNAIMNLASEPGSWTSVGGANSFGIPGADSNLLTPTNIGSGVATASLIEIQPTNSGANPAVVDLGYFSLNSSGELTYTVPSTSVPSSTSRLVNISTRSPVGAASETQIAGFVIAGSHAKTVLIRASGPALAPAPFNVSGALPDPVLTLFSGQTQLATNTEWGTAANAADIASTAAAAGAFSWTAGSADSAILVTLQPGVYTAQVTSASGDTGVALVEVYDCDASDPDSELVNISTRSSVGTGANIQIAGFVIEGSQAKTVLIRASGPALAPAPFSVSGVLPDPVLALFSGSTQIATNTGWGTAANAADIMTTAAAAGAFPWTSGSADSAILITLQPGSYTAQVSGASGDSGVALVEVYDADP
jgi:hypothetical protein